MNKMLALTVVAALAVLAVQVIVSAEDGVVVNPAPTRTAPQTKTGEPLLPGSSIGYFGAAVPPVPVPPGVATQYSLPCAVPMAERTVNVEYLIRELGEGWKR